MALSFRLQRGAAMAMCIAAALGCLLVLVLTAGPTRIGDVPSVRAAPVGLVASLAAFVLMFRSSERWGAWAAGVGLLVTLGVATLPATDVPTGRGVQDIGQWVAPLAVAAVLAWRVAPRGGR